MNHPTFRTIALSTLALAAACGPKPDPAATAAAPSAPAAPASGVSQTGTDLTPGLWRMTFAMTGIEAPGAPPEVAAALQGMGQTSSETSESCMTAADGKDGLSKIVGEMRQGESCTTREFSQTNGRVRADIACGKGSETGTVTMTGSYSATSLDLTIVGGMAGSTELGDAKVTMTIKGERIGDCPA